MMIKSNNTLVTNFTMATSLWSYKLFKKENQERRIKQNEKNKVKNLIKMNNKITLQVRQYLDEPILPLNSLFYLFYFILVDLI